MTNLEIIALIFIVISLIKIIVIFINPKFWYGPENPIVRLVWNKSSATILSLIIGSLILYHLLTEINIIQVFVALIFTFVLAILTLAHDIRKIFDFLIKHLTRERMLTDYWFPLFVWLALIAWVSWELMKQIK